MSQVKQSRAARKKRVSKEAQNKLPPTCRTFFSSSPKELLSKLDFVFLMWENGEKLFSGGRDVESILLLFLHPTRDLDK